MKVFKWVHPTQKYPTYEEMNAIRAANLLLNNDAHGARWIKSNRPAVEKDHEPTFGRRRSRRNR